MNREAVLHIPKSQYAYAYRSDELRIRLRTARGDAEAAELVYAVKYEWQSARRQTAMQKTFSDAQYDYYTVSIDVPDSRIGYIFLIRADGKTYYFSEEGLSETYDHAKSYYNFFQYPYINPGDLHPKVSWCDDAVFYQIFVERFKMGSPDKDTGYIDKRWGELPTPKGFYGGDLEGIRQKLDYLKELGVNCLYLTPIFRSPSNHKYDTVDYAAIDPMFGDKETFRALVDDAHAKGMRIVLDAVFNHGSKDSRQFKDVLKKGKQSKYWDWFIIRGDAVDAAVPNYECFASCAYMPKWNTDNPEVQDYLLGVVTRWMAGYHIDGWRLDVADEVSHQFWKRFRRTVKALDPDAIIIGENWHDARPWLTGDQFDSIMNYSFTKASLDYFAFGTRDAASYCDRLSEILMRNTDQVNEMMLNLLDSHDTERFLTNAGGDKNKLKAALAVMFFFPGMPCIYYGTEIGMTGGYDPDSRRTFDWDRGHWDTDILDTVKGLIRFKRDHIRGPVRLSDENGVLVIGRGDAVLAVNMTTERRAFGCQGRTVDIGANTYKILYKGEPHDEKV